MTLRLLGVESVHFVGALTKSMKENPELINWGLTEIAQVVSTASTAGFGLAVEWEGSRRLAIEFADFEFIEVNPA